MRATWRAMHGSDLPAVAALADRIHIDHPEQPAIFAERLDLLRHGKPLSDEAMARLAELQNLTGLLRASGGWGGLAADGPAGEGLNGVEQDILAAAIAPQGAPRIAWQYQRLQPGVSEPYPTLALLQELLLLENVECVELFDALRAGGPLVQRRLVAIEGYVRAHEYSSYVQLTRDSRGEDPGILQLMSKLNSTNIGSEVARLALEILGDDGLLDPTVQDEMVYLPNANRSWITQYMYSLGIAIAGGSANVQRNVIAERGLGLSRDWWAQRSAGR